MGVFCIRHPITTLYPKFLNYTLTTIGISTSLDYGLDIYFNWSKSKHQAAAFE